MIIYNPEEDSNPMPSHPLSRTSRRIRIDTSKGSSALDVQVFDADRPGSALAVKTLLVRWDAGERTYADIVYTDNTYEFVEVV